MSAGELLRATLFHTPANPFHDAHALQGHSDGGLLVRDGRIVLAGDYHAVRAAAPDAATLDWRGGFLLPGLIDTHVHFPQLRIIGSLGRSLLDWLAEVALPEEARMADFAYAQGTARGFVDALASHGTTTALVFGAHFAPATAALFEQAEAVGLRVVSGLVYRIDCCGPSCISRPPTPTATAPRSLSASTSVAGCSMPSPPDSRCRRPKRCSRCARR
jgi:guanine deaminase